MHKKNYHRYLNTAINLDRQYLEWISNSSKNGLDPELLFSIVVIEKMNRGGFINYLFEKTLSLLAPSIIIKMNASIGLCQIRVGAAKKVLKHSENNIVKKLMVPKNNINIMAKLLKLYNDENTEDKINCRKIILNLHISGKKYVPPNTYLNIYYELVNWSIKHKYFHQFYSKNFKF